MIKDYLECIYHILKLIRKYETTNVTLNKNILTSKTNIADYKTKTIIDSFLENNIITKRRNNFVLTNKGNEILNNLLKVYSLLENTEFYGYK